MSLTNENAQNPWGERESTDIPECLRGRQDAFNCECQSDPKLLGDRHVYKLDDSNDIPEHLQGDFDINLGDAPAN